MASSCRSGVSQRTERGTLAELRDKECRTLQGEFLSRPLVPPPLSTSSVHVSVAGWTWDELLSSTVDASTADVSLLPSATHNASVSPGRRPRRSSSSSLVHRVLVEDQQVNIWTCFRGQRGPLDRSSSEVTSKGTFGGFSRNVFPRTAPELSFRFCGEH